MEKKVPVYFIRYEDLVLDPLSVMEGAYAFLCNTDSIEGTVIQKRIKDILGMGHEASVSYKPKGIGINKNAAKFPPELMKHVMDELEDINYFFGYTNIPEKENKVQIFDYGTEHKKESLEKIEGYLKANQAAMEWCVKDTESLKKVQYHVNKPEDLIKIERPYYPGKLRSFN